MRKVKVTELDSLIDLLNDNAGKPVNSELRVRYKRAFNQIVESEYFDLIVWEVDKTLVGCFQILYIPHLSYSGTMRAQLEFIKIHPSFKQENAKEDLLRFAILKAKENGCGVFQVVQGLEDENDELYESLGLKPVGRGRRLYLDH